jgi:16S rRNA (adenine1518-N6/adenine1519-N6)-dimethyltransferase
MGQKFGQHFLHDQWVLHRIIEQIEKLVTQSEWGMSILEIGPGRWALTKYLLQKEWNLVLSEIDITLKEPLEHLLDGRDIPIVWGDVLEQKLQISTPWVVNFWWQHLETWKTLIVGNLPYYITSPILRKFFADQCFPGWVFLIQQEVAEKIRRDAHKKSYLRRLLNRTHKVIYAFTVKAWSFSPPPNVVSSVIRLEELPVQNLEDVFEEPMLRFLDLASPFKRKTLGKIQKMKKTEFEFLGITIPDDLLGKRLEELWWEEMKRIVSTH